MQARQDPFSVHVVLQGTLTERRTSLRPHLGTDGQSSGVWRTLFQTDSPQHSILPRASGRSCLCRYENSAVSFASAVERVPPNLYARKSHQNHFKLHPKRSCANSKFVLVKRLTTSFYSPRLA